MTAASHTGAKDIQVLVGVDVDAVAGWLGSYGGGDSPSDIQRGMFAGEVGSPRLLTLLNREEVVSTWFIPGHSIETFPEQMAAVAEAGHEIGAHGYSHENPIALTEEQERDVMARSVELIAKLTGKAPRGYVAPWWETSERGALLLKEFGSSRRRTATGSSARATSSSCGGTSSTGSTGRWTTRSYRSRCTPMSAAGPRCCSCSSGSSGTCAGTPA
jgi:hypothetical protein